MRQRLLKVSNQGAIKRACFAISDGDINSAKSIIDSEFPFLPLSNSGRQYTDYQKTKVFMRRYGKGVWWRWRELK